MQGFSNLNKVLYSQFFRNAQNVVSSAVLVKVVDTIILVDNFI